MASRRIDDLHPVLAYAFGMAKMEWMLTKPIGIPEPILTCTYRSGSEQNALYNQPFDKKDNDGDGKVDEPDEKVTNARAGQSAHNYLPSMAFDVAFKRPDGSMDWDSRLFDAFAKILLKRVDGITWGGNFKSLVDRPHFEITGWEKLGLKPA